MARKITKRDTEIAQDLLWKVITPTIAAERFGVKTRNDAYRTGFRALQFIHQKQQ